MILNNSIMDNIKICCNELREHIAFYEDYMIMASKIEGDYKIDILSDGGHGGIMENVKYCPFCGGRLEIEE